MVCYPKYWPFKDAATFTCVMQIHELHCLTVHWVPSKPEESKLSSLLYDMERQQSVILKTFFRDSMHLFRGEREMGSYMQQRNAYKQRPLAVHELPGHQGESVCRFLYFNLRLHPLISNPKRENSFGKSAGEVICWYVSLQATGSQWHIEGHTGLYSWQETYHCPPG